jgi:hypothetical protein
MLFPGSKRNVGDVENMLMATIDKHAPLRSRRTRKRKSPWITNELKRRIYNRDYLKKKAI